MHFSFLEEAKSHKVPNIPEKSDSSTLRFISESKKPMVSAYVLEHYPVNGAKCSVKVQGVFIKIKQPCLHVYARVYFTIVDQKSNKHALVCNCDMLFFLGERFVFRCMH